MSSYVVSGASRGLGYEFIRQLSDNPANTVIGLVRNKEETEARVAAELQRSNIHIIHGDLTDYESLKKAAEDTAKITGGGLDYLIGNAGIVSQWGRFNSIDVLGEDVPNFEQELLSQFKTNVIGNIHLFNIFTTLVLKGHAKKVIAISSGLADIEAASKYNLDHAAPYCIGKSGLNAAVAKFSARYAKDGILFMSICPGAVDTGHNSTLTEEEQPKAMAIFGKFNAYEPSFTGESKPEDAIKDVLSVIERSSVEAGDGGSFVSHFGNKRWL
ncbi:hypothetical protein V490_03476 [Pseudogymnoascus sp. VKM F-3557]|nr:hypothetical protein V490_03476 [Pseudogymnoascus sp. VKM F-3557]